MSKGKQQLPSQFFKCIPPCTLLTRWRNKCGLVSKRFTSYFKINTLPIDMIGDLLYMHAPKLCKTCSQKMYSRRTTLIFANFPCMKPVLGIHLYMDGSFPHHPGLSCQVRHPRYVKSRMQSSHQQFTKTTQAYDKDFNQSTLEA